MRRLKNFLLVALILAGVGACASAPGLRPTAYQAKNVIVLILDGPRESETWRDPKRAHIPHLNKELAPQGTLLIDFKANGPTYTSSGHTALCTGIYEDLENSKGSELPTHPSMFQAFRRASGLGANKAWVIVTKDKLAILGDTRDKAWQGKYKPKVWAGFKGKGLGSGYGEDPDTVAAVKEILTRDHPRLVLINLKHPDSGGHTGVWKNYIDGLEASDAYAAELWATVQADPFYRDKTAFIITHDHGRHLDGISTGFKDHGDACAGCRAISLLALGPDFKKGVEIESVGEQVDLPPTIGAILGFDIPWAKGRVLTEIFK